MTLAHAENVSEASSDTASEVASEAHPPFHAKHPSILAEAATPTRARDNRIRDKDNVRYETSLYDGIEYPYLLEELLATRTKYNVAFTRTPRNERCIFCNAKYLGETMVRLYEHGYAVANHIWCVDFYRANNKDFSHPVEGLLMIWCKKWRNVGAPAPARAFEGLCAVTADGRRDILAIECSLEASL